MRGVTIQGSRSLYRVSSVSANLKVHCTDFWFAGVAFQASPSPYSLFVFRAQPLFACQNASLEACSYVAPHLTRATALPRPFSPCARTRCLQRPQKAKQEPHRCKSCRSHASSIIIGMRKRCDQGLGCRSNTSLTCNTAVETFRQLGAVHGAVIPVIRMTGWCRRAARLQPVCVALSQIRGQVQEEHDHVSTSACSCKMLRAATR